MLLNFKTNVLFIVNVRRERAQHFSFKGSPLVPHFIFSCFLHPWPPASHIFIFHYSSFSATLPDVKQWMKSKTWFVSSCSESQVAFPDFLTDFLAISADLPDILIDLLTHFDISWHLFSTFEPFKGNKRRFGIRLDYRTNASGACATKYVFGSTDLLDLKWVSSTIWHDLI